MAIYVSNDDLRLIRQPRVECTLRLEILNEDETILDVIEGLIECGSFSIDSSSDIRRTCNFTIIPTNSQGIKIDETSRIWLNKGARLLLGITDLINSNITWYSMGYFVFISTSIKYDANSNTLDVSCSDYMSKLDGSRNGTLGQLETTIPAYEEDSTTGEVIKHNYIRDAILFTAGQLGRVKKMMVSEVGEYKGLEDRNPNGYVEYRKANPTWNSVPYDLEFSVGDTVLTILTKLRDLYPNYEMFFDKDNVFNFQMKPSCYEDDIVLDNSQIQSILLSDNTEDSSLEFTEVKNISEVWGEVIEVDFFTDKGVTYTSNTYNVPNDAYIDPDWEADEKHYYNGDTIAFRVPTTNSASPSLNIEKLGAIPIYNGEGTALLESGVLLADRVYSFKIIRRYDLESKTYKTWAIYLGQYQPHGMTVLLNYDRHDETYTTNTGKTVEKYSPEYFYELYDVNSQNLTRTINPDSPFAIERIGEILQAEQNDDIYSDDLARAQSEYNNYVSSRLTDKISITTLLAPWLDVNIKISYQPKSSDELNQYIIDSISHDFENGTSTISMHRFYPLYSWL